MAKLRAFWRSMGTLLAAVGRRKRLAIVVSALASLIVAIGITTIRTPVPKVHDEFSYLLAADTFANGRLANPIHPAWRHFETFHVIHQPSYASKYPPAQGLILAIGQVVGGHPICGVWLATALAAAAICWMLQGWFSPRWALLGVLLVAVHAGVQLQWGQSYWGGAVAMTGGGLMIGAVPRLRKGHPKDAVILALGAVILASSRPFEGAVLAVCCGVWLLANVLRDMSWQQFAIKVFLPATGVLAIGAALLGFYNASVTGSALKMPYGIHEARYAVSPIFLWQSPEAAPDYAHHVMGDFFQGWAMDAWRQQQSLAGILRYKGNALLNHWAFYLGLGLTLALVPLAQLVRDKRLRLPLIALAVVTAASACVPWSFPHYIAPAAPLVLIVVVQGMRYLHAASRDGKALSACYLPGIIALQVCLFGISVVQYASASTDGWQWRRAELAAELRSQPGKHLVLVEYDPDHNVHAEWVYNRADLDEANVLWARSMSPAEDARLMEHFSNRRIWRLRADQPQPDLVAVMPGNADFARHEAQ